MEQLRQTSKEIGNLGYSREDFIKKLLVPSIKKGLFEQYNIAVYHTNEHRGVHKGGEKMKMDIIAFNSDKVVVIEARIRLERKYIDSHIEKLTRFKEFFEDLEDKIILGGVAGATLESGADNYAMNKGLFFIKQRGDHVRIENGKSFQPKEW